MALSRHQVEIIQKCTLDSTLQDLLSLSKKTDRTKFKANILNPLIDAELLEMTIPGKPNSKLQKYRLTEKGKKNRRGHQGLM